jgi:CRP/FNR family cyclic AMP-dependent transcriptional regulator
MTHWMCTNCGYFITGAAPPNRCPSCNLPCQFNNVTCYRPECGGEDNIDPLLVGATLRLGGRPAAVPAANLEPKFEGVAKVHIFSGLTREQEERILTLGKTENYQPGTVITRQGEPSQKLYIVQEGKVAINRAIAFQKQLPITSVGPGEVFGWSSLVPPRILTASATATEKTTALAIDAEQLERYFRWEPQVGLIVMRNVAALVASRLKTVEMEIAGYIYA